MELLSTLQPGVQSGTTWARYNLHLKAKRAALPAVCVTSNSTINACLEAAKQARSPIILLSSFKGSRSMAGHTLPDDYRTWTLGARAMADYVHLMAPAYGVPVFLSTDHCYQDELPWLHAMLDIDQKRFDETGQALWSGHMADLSTMPIEEAADLYVDLIQRHAKCGVSMEFELGMTGGEEDGHENETSGDHLYTNAEDALRVYRILSEVSPLVMAALSFGNVHGVYKGKFDLRPEILKDSQALVHDALKTDHPLPMDLSFHGGSGCTEDQIREAIAYGIVRQNIDTDTQWALTNGLVTEVLNRLSFLQTQIGNPLDPEAPNKKFYDWRSIVPFGERAMTDRVLQSYDLLNSHGLLAA